MGEWGAILETPCTPPWTWAATFRKLDALARASASRIYALITITKPPLVTGHCPPNSCWQKSAATRPSAPSDATHASCLHTPCCQSPNCKSNHATQFLLCCPALLSGPELTTPLDEEKKITNKNTHTAPFPGVLHAMQSPPSSKTIDPIQEGKIFQSLEKKRSSSSNSCKAAYQ